MSKSKPELRKPAFAAIDEGPRPDPFILDVMIVCNPCGSLMKGQWVEVEGGRQVAIAVEKCTCADFSVVTR